LAAKAATASVPIVFETGLDPIKLGLVTSLNRPGGNITGVTQLSSELLSKRLGLLHDVLPAAATIGFLVDPTYPGSDSQARDLQEAARTLGLQVQAVSAATEAEIDTAFANFTKLRVGGLYVGGGTLFIGQAKKLAWLVGPRNRSYRLRLLENIKLQSSMSSSGSSFIFTALRIAPMSMPCLLADLIMQFWTYF